jgi:DNA-binding beta-propeller fold protein YncE
MKSSARPGALLLAFALAFCSLATVALPQAACAAVGDPIFIFKPVPPPIPLPPLIPPPAGQFEGPCGLAVDATGNFYVSDYYHHAVDVFTSDTEYLSQRANEDPLDGPCGLALGPGGNVYVNNFHRNVVRFNPAPTFGVGTVIAGAGVDASHPTGVAVDGAGTVYVDERDHVATFDAAGVEEEPIGTGSLGDAFGVAVSGYPATAGFVYVPDADTRTVKVFDPATSRTTPIAEIDGSGTPPGHFISLRDAAIAVDDVTGTVYVVDDLTPEYTEGHESVVYAFDDAGTYLGRLKYSIQSALPAGLAVDNSATATQGRVYVTSGYSERAEVYAYPPGSAGSGAVPLPDTAFATAPPVPSGSPPAPVAASAAPPPAAIHAPVQASGSAGAVPASPTARADRKRHAHRAAHRRHRPHRAARGRGR